MVHSPDGTWFCPEHGFFITAKDWWRRRLWFPDLHFDRGTAAGGAVTLARPRRPFYRWAILIYDCGYRRLHGLDHPAAEVGPALRVTIQRCWRARRLPDGTWLRHRDRVGILHLNNSRIAAIHLDGQPPLGVGLEFRRQLVASLRALAAGQGVLSDVQAFTATTILPRGLLLRLGFESDLREPAWPGVVAAYQRALLASLHPLGTLRLAGTIYRPASRFWLTRQVLLARYGRADDAAVARGAMPKEFAKLQGRL
jgi:hypothetical protein